MKQQNNENKQGFKHRLSFDGLLILLLAVVCLVVFYKFISLESVYLFKDIGSDTINAVYPQLIHVSEYLRSEGIPRWSFGQGLGQNITNSGIDNPFNWLLYILGKNKLAYGIIFIEIFKILLTAWLCYRWLLSLFLNHFAAFFGAVAFALSGYMLVGGSWYVHSLLCFKIVLLFWAFEKGYRHQVWLWWSLAVFFSFDVNFIFIGQFFLLYILFRISLQDDTFKNKALKETEHLASKLTQSSNTFWGLLKPLFAYSVLGVLMKAPIIGSIYYRIWDSPRLQEDFSASGSLLDASFFETPLHYATVVLRTLGNDLLGNGSAYLGWKNYLEAPLLYCGILTLILIPQAFVFMRKKERLAYGLLLSFWLVIIAFPFARYAYYWFSGDYYKVAVSAFFPLTCILCACRALIGFQNKKPINVSLLIITVIGLLVLIFLPYELLNINIQQRWFTVVFIIVSGLVVYALNKSKNILKANALVGLTLLLVIEMGFTSYQTVNNRIAVSAAELNEKIGYNDYTLEALNFINKSDKGFYRFSKRFSSSLSQNKSLNDGKAQGFFGTSSYSSFNQGHYVNFLTQMGVIERGDESQSRWIMGLHKRPNLEKLVGLKYVLGDANLDNNDLRSLTFYGGKTLFQKKEVMPLGFVYTQYFPEASFMRLSNQQKDCAILNAVVISEEDGKTKQHFITRFTEPISNNCFPDVINELPVSSFSNNQIIYNGKHPSGIFFTSIPFDKGWYVKVKCDNEVVKTDVENVNFGFIGIPLQKACENAEINLYYIPPFSRIGLIIAIFAWSTLLFLFYTNRKKKLI